MRRHLVLFSLSLALTAGCFEPPEEAPTGGASLWAPPQQDSCQCVADAGTFQPTDGGPAVFRDGGRQDAGNPPGQDAGEREDAGRPGVRDAGVDAGCNTSALLSTTLPFTLHEAAAFFDGQKIWALGGSSQGSVARNAIFSFDPATETITSSSAVLPNAEAAAYFASKGSVIYLFGGDTFSGLLRTIVKFDASTQTVTTMNAQLPTARYKGAAVWSGRFIYLVGGWNGSTVISDILKYDTVNDTITQVPSHDSLKREQAAGFDLGGFLYIASGHIAQTLTTYPTVIRIDPANDSLTTLSEQNPIPRFFTGNGSDGTRGYVFGGINASNTDTNEIMRFDPAAQTFQQVGCLGIPRHGNAWTYANGSFYALGGMNVPTYTWLNSIQRWTPP